MRDVAAELGAAGAERAARAPASFSGPATTSGSPTAPGGRERRQRVLARLDRADEEQVAVVRCPPGAKRGSTPLGVTVTFAGGDAVAGDDVALRPLGDDEHVVGAARRPRDDERGR